MKTGNVYLVILLVILIIVLSNLAMYSLVRGGYQSFQRWLSGRPRGGFQPFAGEDQALEELNRRVQGLREDTPHHP